jgi:hypothetical protein
MSAPSMLDVVQVAISLLGLYCAWRALKWARRGVQLQERPQLKITVKIENNTIRRPSVDDILVVHVQNVGGRSAEICDVRYFADRGRGLPDLVKTLGIMPAGQSSVAIEPGDDFRFLRRVDELRTLNKDSLRAIVLIGPDGRELDRRVVTTDVADRLGRERTPGQG